MVHLVEYHVGGVGYRRAAVVGPALGIGLGEIDNGGTLSVDTHGLGPDAGCLFEPFAIVFNLESIVAVVGHRRQGVNPCAPFGALHVVGAQRLAAAAVLVQAQLHGRSFGRPKTESGAGAVDGKAQVVARVSWELRKAGIGVRRCGRLGVSVHRSEAKSAGKRGPYADISH